MPKHYEMHLTVDLNDQPLDCFNQVCSLIGAKPIIINAKDVQQVMTSKTDDTSLQDAYEQMKQDVVVLMEHGFDVTRVKLETNEVDDLTKVKYIEIHIPCHTRKLVEYPDLIKQLHFNSVDGQVIKGHISYNEVKPNVKFVTYRFLNLADIDKLTPIIETLLNLQIISYGNYEPEFEFIVYDSNQDLDTDWLND